MTLRIALLVLVPFLSRFLVPRAGAAPTGQEPPAAWVCPPCGAECHFRTSAEAGHCGVCGMELVPLASVPQVGVLLQPRSALGSSLGTLAAFSAADVARAFCVADTREPLRLNDAVEVRPQFAFGDAPPLDVLVVSDAFGAWEDPLIVEWVQAQATHARYVLAIATGSILLAEAGFLEGEHVPGSRFLAQRGRQFSEKVVFDAELRWRRSGKFLLVRDADAAVDASLWIVRELAGEEHASSAARSLGRAWPPADLAALEGK